jgi:hypothetical protein
LKALSGKVIFSALYGAYTVALTELKSLLKANNLAGGATTDSESGKPTQEDGFKEVRRRKRHSYNVKETSSGSHKHPQTRGRHAELLRSSPGNNYGHRFLGAEASTLEEAVPGKEGRPPSIILTSTTNLIQLQRQLKNVAK